MKGPRSKTWNVRVRYNWHANCTSLECWIWLGIALKIRKHSPYWLSRHFQVKMGCFYLLSSESRKSSYEWTSGSYYGHAYPTWNYDRSTRSRRQCLLNTLQTRLHRPNIKALSWLCVPIKHGFTIQTKRMPLTRGWRWNPGRMYRQCPCRYFPAAVWRLWGGLPCTSCHHNVHLHREKSISSTKSLHIESTKRLFQPSSSTDHHNIED